MKDTITISKMDGLVVKTIKPKKKHKKWNSNDVTLILMASLSVIFLAVFAYAPLYGLILAFKVDGEFIDISKAIKQGSWADYHGFEQFRMFFIDPDIKNIMMNTLGLNTLQLLITPSLLRLYAL